MGALCAALGQDKRVDVLCAPDVKQILSFAATAAMIGTQSGPGGGPGNAIQERLERTKHVVSSTFNKVGGKFILVVRAGPKAADAQAAALYSDKPIIALEEKADQQRALLDRLSAMAPKITGALFAPSSPSAPPAPLGPATK